MKLAELVNEYLSNEGFPHDIDNDGDIHFRYMGANLFFTVDEKDPSFFRIIMPGVYEIDNDREKVLETINSLCAELKVLKAFIINDNLWLAIEMFVDSAPDLSEYFQRCCDILLEGRRRAAQEISK